MRIEYDANGMPAIVWPPEIPFVSLREIQMARYISSLPMPAMREWARARGLIL